MPMTMCSGQSQKLKIQIVGSGIGLIFPLIPELVINNNIFARGGGVYIALFKKFWSKVPLPWKLRRSDVWRLLWASCRISLRLWFDCFRFLFQIRFHLSHTFEFRFESVFTRSIRCGGENTTIRKTIVCKRWKRFWNQNLKQSNTSFEFVMNPLIPPYLVRLNLLLPLFNYKTVWDVNLVLLQFKHSFHYIKETTTGLIVWFQLYCR